MEQKSSFQHQLLHKELFQICKGFKNCFRSLILDQIQIILHSPSVKTNWIELMRCALLQLLSSLITLSHVVICSATTALAKRLNVEQVGRHIESMKIRIVQKLLLLIFFYKDIVKWSKWKNRNQMTVIITIRCAI